MMRASTPRAAAEARTGVATAQQTGPPDGVLTDLETLDARPGRGSGSIVRFGRAARIVVPCWSSLWEAS